MIKHLFLVVFYYRLEDFRRTNKSGERHFPFLRSLNDLACSSRGCGILLSKLHRNPTVLTILPVTLIDCVFLADAVLPIRGSDYTRLLGWAFLTKGHMTAHLSVVCFTSFLRGVCIGKHNYHYCSELRAVLVRDSSAAFVLWT